MLDYRYDVDVEVGIGLLPVRRSKMALLCLEIGKSISCQLPN